MGNINTLCQSNSPIAEETVERLLSYLTRYPYDLIDASRLLRRLRVSPREFLEALNRLEKTEKQATSSDAGQGSGTIRPFVEFS